MKILKVTNPDVSLLLLPWYVEVDMTREQIGFELNRRLLESPDDTLVLIITDTEKQQIRGFAIAYVRYEDVFIWQARSINLNSKEVDMVLAEICLWAKYKGVGKIAGVPNRSARIWKRRWGFIEANNNEVVKEI